MSELCKLYCPNYTDCHTKLDQAVGEGRILDVQEQKWSESQANLPRLRADAVLKTIGLEFEYSLVEAGDTSADNITNDSSSAESSDTPSHILKARADLAEKERSIDIVDRTLVSIRERQEVNTQEITILGAGVLAVEAAADECSGPKFNLLGKLRLIGDRQAGSVTLPEAHLMDYAKCSSKAAKSITAEMPAPHRQYVPLSE